MPVSTSLAAERERILTAVAALEALVEGERPMISDPLFWQRWAFTREMLNHFSAAEAKLLVPLCTDMRPEIAREAAEARGELDLLTAAFARHVHRWHRFPAKAEWPVYRAAVLAFTGALRGWCAREAVLCEALPAQTVPARDVAPPVDYARCLRDVRNLLFGEHAAR